MRRLLLLLIPTPLHAPFFHTLQHPFLLPICINHKCIYNTPLLPLNNLLFLRNLT